MFVGNWQLATGKWQMATGNPQTFALQNHKVIE
jgi:hypothetical protein